MSGGRRNKSNSKIELKGELKRLAPEANKAADVEQVRDMMSGVDELCLETDMDGVAGEIVSVVNPEAVNAQIRGEIPHVKVTHNMLAKLEIGIRSGLSEENACVLSGLTIKEYNVILRKYPKLSAYVETWKHDLDSRIELNLAQAVYNGDIEITKWLAQNRMPEKYTAGQNRKLEVSQTVKHKMLLPTEEDMVKVQRMVHMKLNLDNVKLPESTGIPASQGVYDDDYDEDEDNDAVNV